MARRKRNSIALERAERRLESLVSIDNNLDLGNGLSVSQFSDLIDDLAAKLAAYNTTLSSIDKLADDVKVSEKAVNIMAEQMLMGVGCRYGKTSQEYEMAGGSRRKGSVSRSTTAKSVAKATVARGNLLVMGLNRLRFRDPHSLVVPSGRFEVSLWGGQPNFPICSIPFAQRVRRTHFWGLPNLQSASTSTQSLSYQ